MKEPTKADLAAAVAKLTGEVARLTEENGAHRELLAAISALATVPAAADWTAVAYVCNLESRLIRLAAYSMTLDGVGPNIMARVIRDRAQVLRDEAAEPVRYELRAEPVPDGQAAAVLAESIRTGTPLAVVDDPCECRHGDGLAHRSANGTPIPCAVPGCGCGEYRPRAEADAPEPPSVVAGEVVEVRPVVRVPGPHPDESAFRKGYAPDESAPSVVAGEVVANPPRYVPPGTGERCRAVAPGSFICTAQPGHDGPEHVAYGTDGKVCRRWPVGASLRIGGNLVPLGGAS